MLLWKLHSNKESNSMKRHYTFSVFPSNGFLFVMCSLHWQNQRPSVLVNKLPVLAQPSPLKSPSDSRLPSHPKRNWPLRNTSCSKTDRGQLHITPRPFPALALIAFNYCTLYLERLSHVESPLPFVDLRWGR